jgi:Flp pilus assembly protein TadG
VEFAILAPLLVTLLLGMIEFGRAMMVMELMNNAARNGCRTAVINGSDTAAVTQAVNYTLNSTTVSGATVTVLVNGTQADVNTAITGDAITVTVSVPIANVSWLPTSLFLSGANLTGTAVMRRE